MRIKFLGLLPLLALVLSACSDDNGGMQGDATGKVNVSLTADRSVSRATGMSRAEDEASAQAVDINKFKIHIAKDDGKYDKTWETLAEFDPATEQFLVGTYTVEASYGALDDEGFEKPYYYGISEKFAVLDSETANPTVTATLANTMVAVNYTEAFKNYFTDYTTTIHSAGGSRVEFAKAENRTAYVRPGNITIEMSLTKTTGKQFTFEPAAIEDAKAKTLYNITFDVNGGEVGDATLSITFDETTVEEPIEIDLSDELVNAPAPALTVKGFTPGTAIDLMEGDDIASSAQFVGTAQSGIKSVTLTTQSAYLKSKNWPDEIDLVAATTEQKELLQNLGLQVIGLWGNVDKMCVVKFDNLLKNLRAYEGDKNHTFTLQVKDKYSKVSDAISLSVVTTPVTLSFSAAEPLAPQATSLKLTVNYNGKDLKNNVKFTGRDDYGKWVDCPITDVQTASEGVYTVTVTIPAGDNVDFLMKASYNNGLVATQEVTIKRQQSLDLTVAQGDVWSTEASVMMPAGQSLIDGATIMIKKGDGAYTEVAAADITRDAAHKLFVLKNLEAGVTYKVKASKDGEEGNEVTFATEAATAVPNGDFEDLAETIKISDMNQGGKWSPTIGDPTYQNTCSFTVKEPTGWASVNAKTCNKSATNQMSWFVIPSTYNTTLSWTGTVQRVPIFGGGGTETPDIYKDLTAQSGSNAMVVRNVAWDANGTSPANHYKTRTSSEYYSMNVPTIANRSAGKLFLGSYTYSNGQETYNEGTAFASRPVTLKGYYKYVRDNQDASELGVVTVKLLNNGTVIGEGTAELYPQTDYTQFTVNIAYSNTSLKADKLQIMICSSNHESNIKTTDYTSRYESASRGAQLTIDNLTFSYK